MDGDPLVTAYQGFVTELVTVEKRNIAALTEIVRDALQTNPQAAPSLAAVITNRVLQAPASLKLPALYLLDSVSKNVGEPYLSYFSASLPEVFASAWVAGGPALHRPLEKLLGTWVGVFPQAVLDATSARLPKPAAPQYAAPGYGYTTAPLYPQHAAPAPQYAAPVPQYQHQPMMPDPRHAMQPPYGPPDAAQPMYAAPGYGAPAYAAAPQQPMYAAAPQAQPSYGGYGAAPQHYQQPPLYQQQPPQTQQPRPLQPPPLAPLPAPPRHLYGEQELPSGGGQLPDIMSSLVSSGLLPPTAVRPPTPPFLGQGGDAHSAGPGQPPSVEFPTERIKDLNAAAVHRLLALTEATKTRFLDRKFLRRQKLGGGLRASRMWYVDLDTWMASTTGGGAAAAAAAQTQQQAAVAAAAEETSEPVDDEQTHCALSGERFEQYWEERHQEWRYRGAKRLSEEEAARHGLEEGALVLVSALGAPEGLLEPDGEGGVVEGLQHQQEVAAELAAAALGAGAEEATAADIAVEPAPADEAADVKPDLKRPLEGEAAEGEGGQEVKRLKPAAASDPPDGGAAEPGGGDQA